MVGFEVAGVAAARVRDPARNVVRATLFGTALTGLVYVVVCTGIIFAMPLAVIAGSAAPVATFIESFWGRGAGLLVSAFIAVSAIGALNCWVLMQGEVPLGMARAGLLPRWFGAVNGRDVAVRVLILASLLASALILSNAIDTLEGVLQFMLQLTAAATLWVYIGVTLAALRMGIARVAALVGLAFALWALWGAGVEAAGLSLALMLTAIPLYWLRSGRLAVLDEKGSSSSA
jgi:APA family basic amino acid/polyamine antiporter